jgi:glutaredoxin
MKINYYLKQSVYFVVTIIIGLIIGYALINFKDLTKKSYVEGDYSEFYAGAKSQIILYGTATCPYCKEARSYFQSKNIAFTDYDVDTHEKGRKDYQKLEGEFVPIILIGHRKIPGFDPDAIDDALNALR